MADFLGRRARQLMNSNTPVPAGSPLAESAASSQIYGVLPGPDHSVSYRFGDTRFILCRDDAIKMSLLALKYAGVEVDLGEKPAGESDKPNGGSSTNGPAPN